MQLIALDELLEALTLRLNRTRSQRRRMLGLGTRREQIGFEKEGERRIVPKRKRPKKNPGKLLARTPYARRQKS